MASKLPTAGSFNRPTPRGAGGVATTSGTQISNTYGRANIRTPLEATPLAGVGEALGEIGQQLEEKQRKEKQARDKQEIATAKSLWARKRIEIERSFVGDEDPTTLTERQQETLRTAQGEILGAVVDPRNLEALTFDFDLDVEAEGLRSDRVAHAHISSMNLADIDSQIEANTVALPDARDAAERDGLIKMNKALVQSKAAYGATPEQIQLQTAALDKTQRTFEYNHMRDGVYSTISGDPAAASFALEEGSLGAELEPEDLRRAKDHASNAFTKHTEKLQRDALIAEVNHNQNEVDTFFAGIGDGSYTLADAENYRKIKGKDTPLYRYMVDELSNPAHKLPKPSIAAKRGAWNSLHNRYASFSMDSGVAGNADILQLKQFQNDIDTALDDRLITARQHSTFTKSITSARLNMVNEDSLGLPIEREGWRKSGVQDPYTGTFKKIDKYLKTKKREKDILFKQDLVEFFTEELNRDGGYESSGNTKQDKAKIEEAWAAAKELATGGTGLSGQNVTPPATRFEDPATDKLYDKLPDGSYKEVK